MLFLNVLLFFILATFAVAAPVDTGPEIQWQTVSTQNPEVHTQVLEWMNGYWYANPVSEHCSFSRRVCIMNLIYLNRKKVKGGNRFQM